MSGHVDLIGAGQCGALLASMLAERGYDIAIYERGPDPRSGTAAAGRSINLALATRGFNALQRAGVVHRVEPLLVPMRGRMVHDLEGNSEFQAYGQREHEQIYSVSRGQLNQIMLDVAEDSGRVTVHFEKPATGYDVDARQLQLADGTQVDAPVIVAADGAGSAIRQTLDQHHGISASEELLAHGYKELTIPAGPNGAFQLRPDALHIWARGEFMLIALANPGGDFTLTLFMPNEGDVSFASITDEASASAFIEQYFASVAPLIDDPVNALLNNPLGLLGTVRCERWHVGNALLIGDAAHAVVPFHGQGMNLAFEDCVVLTDLLDAGHTDWSTLFAAYEAKQHANANAIADMALENYVEMRASVLDPAFVLQKALAFELERRLPDRFIPRYSMVMFHAEIPYAVAQQRGRIQSALLAELTAGFTALEEIDIDHAVAAAEARLEPLSSA